MVLWTDWVSMLLWLPATVSVTTKSIGLSVDRPIWEREREREKLYKRVQYWSMLKSSCCVLHVR